MKKQIKIFKQLKIKKTIYKRKSYKNKRQINKKAYLFNNIQIKLT